MSDKVMSRWVLGVAIGLLVVVIGLEELWDSERSKRIELEAEIHRHICKVFERGTFYTQLWPTEQFGMSLQEMFDRNHEALDSLPAVPPESEVTE